MIVAALFTRNTGDPATLLALGDIEMYLYSRNKTTSVVTTLWSAVNPTEEIGGSGLYTRWYAGADLERNDYFSYSEYVGAVVLDSDFSLQNCPAELDAASIWSYSSRTLTLMLQLLQSRIRGEEISILRGDTLDLDITGLGDISARSNIWFTVKDDKDDLDTVALIQIDELTGLLFINRAVAAVAANGSITVTNAVAGNLTIRLEAVETAKLPLTGNFYYDIQVLTNAGDVNTLRMARASIIGDVSRVVS